MDSSFILSKFHRLLAMRLQRFAETPGDRLLVSVPPRHGKSRLISELFPAWLQGRNPFERIMAISYGANLAASFGVKVRTLMNEEMHRLIFPWSVIAGAGHGGGGWAMERDVLLPYVDQSQYADVTSLWQDFSGHLPSYFGQYLATGVGGPVTGKPCDSGLIDDPIKNRAQADSPAYIDGLHKFFKADFYSRLEPGAKVCVVHTRWSKQDLIGFILANLADFGEWEYIRLPAIADDEADPLGRPLGAALFPEKYNEQALERIRTTVGEQEWQALYQQNPQAGGGSRWRPSYAKWADAPPYWAYTFTIWDCASELHNKADFTAALHFGICERGYLWLIDADMRRVEYPGLLQMLEELDARWRPNKHFVEKASNGIALVQYVQQYMPALAIDTISAHKSKAKEFSLAQPALEAGQVLIASNELGIDFKNMLIEQASDYPTGEHDDLFIAFLHGVRWWQDTDWGSLASNVQRNTNIILPKAKKLMQFGGRVAGGMQW